MSGTRNVGSMLSVGMAFVVIIIILQLFSCGLNKLVTARKAKAAAASHRGGYTLIELLCVMAIIALVMLIAVVGWNSMHPQAKFDAQVSKMETAISLARQYAVTRNEPVLIVAVEPASFAALNAGRLPERCGWGILSASTRVWVKPFVDLDGAVFVSDPLWPDRRNVVGLVDGGAWTQLMFTNIPAPWVSVATPTNSVVSLPGLAIRADGAMYLRPGPGSDCIKPKGFLLAPGRYSGNVAAGWTVAVTGPRRVAVTVTHAGSVFADTITE